MNSETKQPGTHYRWSLVIASAILVPALVLVAVEAGLRVGNVGFATNLFVPCTMQGQPASCYNLFFPAPFFPPGMIKTPQVYGIPAQKPAGTFRIFVLGESAAMGDPDPAYGFSRYLEVMLRDRYPGMKFEVVNTGSVAINSHVLLPIARELAKQRPDVFVIYSGNNEVVGPYGPGTALTSTSLMSLPVIRAEILARSTRIGQLLTSVSSQKREWRGMEMFLDKQVQAGSPLMNEVYANFEQNLRDTVAVARGSGAKVIVATVATNLRDCAPFGSLHKQDLTQDALRNWTALVEQGTESEKAGAYAGALKSYSSAASIDGEYAELTFRIARCLWNLGDYQGAKEKFSRARDLDTLRFRADSRINDINRSVAASFPGVELVDADAVFARQSPDGITGSELIYEHVHLTPQGNYLLARALFPEIANALPAQSERPQAEIPSEDECERLLAFTARDRSRVTEDMLQRLQEPPFTNQLNHSEHLLNLMARAGDPKEDPNDTAKQYQWAIAKEPDDRILHYKFGLFLFPYNQNAAAQQLLMAQPWDGFPVFLPDGRQIR
jgi:tetratricopeptide (TPR) repeat protein